MTCRQPDDHHGVAPHGPTPCSPLGDGDYCACGCSAYEEACPEYEAWVRGQQA